MRRQSDEQRFRWRQFRGFPQVSDAINLCLQAELRPIILKRLFVVAAIEGGEIVSGFPFRTCGPDNGLLRRNNRAIAAGMLVDGNYFTIGK